MFDGRWGPFWLSWVIRSRLALPVSHLFESVGDGTGYLFLALSLTTYSLVVPKGGGGGADSSTFPSTERYYTSAQLD